MDLAAVAVVGHALVGLAGGEVEGTGDLFIEKDVAHGMQDLAIETDGEFTDVARPLVGIENPVQRLGVIGCGFHDPALTELQLDVVEGDPLIDCRRVVGNDSLDGIFHWRAEALTVRDVILTTAGDGFQALQAETEVGAGSNDEDLVGFVHHFFQGLHGWGQCCVVQQTDTEIKVLERLRAHTGELRH